MHISEVYIDGLLSFKDFRVELNEKTNIIVGTNGVGKSNFMKILWCMLNGKTDMYTNEKYLVLIELTIDDKELQDNIKNYIRFEIIHQYVTNGRINEKIEDIQTH